MTEDEVVGWHHQRDEQEFQQTVGDGEGQGSLARCSPWGHKGQTTERRDSNNIPVREGAPPPARPPGDTSRP